jgi:hypothetical protein
MIIVVRVCERTPRNIASLWFINCESHLLSGLLRGRFDLDILMRLGLADHNSSHSTYLSIPVWQNIIKLSNSFCAASLRVSVLSLQGQGSMIVWFWFKHMPRASDKASS